MLTFDAIVALIEKIKSSIAEDNVFKKFFDKLVEYFNVKF